MALGDLIETLRYPGFHRLARRHWRMGARELRGSLLRSAFAAEARRYVPGACATRTWCGRAPESGRRPSTDGSLVDDFRIGRVSPVTAVRNAPSPGATSCLAIAEYVTTHI